MTGKMKEKKKINATTPAFVGDCRQRIQFVGL